MNAKDTVQRLSRDIDEGLHQKDSAEWNGSPEYLELLSLSKALAGQDFSETSDKSDVLDKIQNRVKMKEADRKMKVKNNIRRPAIIMASILIAGVLSVSFVKPSFAQEMLDRVLQKINLGNIIASQYDPDQAPPFPEAWKGKLFDKDGNKIESYTEKLGEVYNANGELIVGFDGDELITKSQQEQRDKEAAAKKVVIKEPAELEQYALFTVKLPKYLPEGFAFDHGEFYKDENGVNGKYLDLFFSSEKKDTKIWMQQRFSDKETAYEMSSSGKMEKVSVSGVDAVMCDERNLDWEADGVLYGLSTKGLERAEVLKIAESIR
ncbi:hypothetical protein A8L34_23395 [Bacillus sp. FJAT-27264]|uniref:DUF4367 domain-containing protein n=1 Tax=Paenibacillus sp. (strain DSM 101736 / FJAT-27264) TaxID=1850362 RepID=UPI000807DC05|nr:DUF4367 domain-containing protein [Bacillus sp. FJAT-27264]OBZ09091.1 hypothetical protein A8L34_23395 [Bacillus sp. FJAT-27264]